MKQLRQRIAKQLVDKGILAKAKKTIIFQTHSISNIEKRESIVYKILKRILPEKIESCSFYSKIQEEADEDDIIEYLSISVLCANLMDKIVERLPSEHRSKAIENAEALLNKYVKSKNEMIQEIFKAQNKMESVL